MTPPCTVCGYAVEWKRSCYRSKWRLFRDSDTATAGRYFFNDNAPFYPGEHNLWSANWISDEQEEGTLGEIKGTRQQWDNGAAPPVRPLPVLVGNPECITLGDRISTADPDRPYVAGFELACLAPPEIPPGLLAESCTDWKWSLGLIELMYAGDAAAIEAYALARFPTAAVTTWYSASGPQPTRTLIRTADWAALHLAGTENYQQLALQAFSLVTGQTQFLHYKTLAFWETQGNIVGSTLYAAGVDPTKPLYLCGHSYGGVIACLLQAKLFWNGWKAQQMQLVTFGCPQPGDRELRRVNSRSTSRHFVNQYDPVPYLPPGATEVLLFAGYIGPALRALWGEWSHPLPSIGVTETGVYYNDPDVTSVFPLVVDALRRLAFAMPQPIFTGHTLASYKAKVQCPGDIPVAFVTSVFCPDGSLIISPITGDVPCILNMLHENLWAAQQSYNQPAADKQAILVNCITGPTVPALLVAGGTDPDEPLFGVQTDIGDTDRYVILADTSQVLLTGAVHVGTAGPDRPHALLVNSKHQESGLVVIRASVSGSPGPVLSVAGEGEGTFLGINGDGNLVTDYTEATPPEDTPTARWPLYNSAGDLLGYLPIYPVVTPPPDPPTGLTATPAGTDIDLAVDDVPAGTTLTIKRGTASGGPYGTTVASGLTVPTATDSTATAGVVYYYVAYLDGPGGTSAASNEASAVLSLAIVDDAFDDLLVDLDGRSPFPTQGAGAGDWAVGEGTFTVAKGYVEALTAGGDGFTVAAVDCGVTDVIIQVAVRRGTSRQIAAVFAYTDKDNFGMLYLTGTDLVIYERVGGSFFARSTVSVATDENVWHTLTVLVNGSTVKGYVNGGDEVTYGSWTQTGTGAGIYADGGSYTGKFMRFANFSVQAYQDFFFFNSVANNWVQGQLVVDVDSAFHNGLGGSMSYTCGDLRFVQGSTGVFTFDSLLADMPSRRWPTFVATNGSEVATLRLTALVIPNFPGMTDDPGNPLLPHNLAGGTTSVLGDPAGWHGTPDLLGFTQTTDTSNNGNARVTTTLASKYRDWTCSGQGTDVILPCVNLTGSFENIIYLSSGEFIPTGGSLAGLRCRLYTALLVDTTWGLNIFYSADDWATTASRHTAYLTTDTYQVVDCFVDGGTVFVAFTDGGTKNYNLWTMDLADPLAGLTFVGTMIPADTGSWDTNGSHWSGGLNKIGNGYYDLVYTAVYLGAHQAMNYAFTDEAGFAASAWYIFDGDTPFMQMDSPWLGDWGDPTALEIGDFRIVRAFELSPPELQLWMSRGTGPTGRAGMIYLQDP